MPERLFLIITLIVSEPPPHFHRFSAFSHSPAPKVRQRAGRVWKFCKKLFFFIFTRYNRGCFSNHRQNTGLPTGGNSFEAYFHQGTLPCLRRRSGAEPRCLRRQGRQCCIQHGIFFRTRQRVRLRLPELQLQRWSGREGLLGGHPRSGLCDPARRLCIRRHQALGRRAHQRGSGGADQRSAEPVFLHRAHHRPRCRRRRHRGHQLCRLCEQRGVHRRQRRELRFDTGQRHFHRRL